MKEAEYRFAMHYLTSFSPAELYAALSYFGSAEEFFGAEPRYLKEALPGVSAASLTVFSELRKPGAIERLYEEMQKKGLIYLPFDDPSFPDRLLEIPDPPFGLFVRGKLPDPAAPAAAIVGARNCSSYGKEYALFFGKQLAGSSVVVISGMALGVDAWAERGALQAGGESYAVLGGGADVCYPREHIALYTELSEKCGILSERPPGYSARSYDFPLRNRLVSGMADVLLVIEAAEHSGTSITVEHALRQNREVFALPGRISDRMSLGCNLLLKNGAQVLTCPEDVLQYLGLSVSGESRKAKRTLIGKEEQAVLDLLGKSPLSMDELLSASALPAGTLSRILLSLEVSGLVRKEAFSGYIRTDG